MAVTLKGQTAVYEGTSTDTKPTDADNNAIFKELDTGIRYYYDGTNWNEIPSSGGGGGGGTGTDNYNELNNKPSINGTTLSGNKSLDNLGIQAKLTFDSAPTEDSENPVKSGGVYSALAGKQDTISDLPIIRSGAAAGASAVQPAAMEAALAQKQDAISDLSTIRSGAAAGATAVQPATLETALAGKQDALSSEQLDAVNSGITSADVEQITTNKNNISKDEAALVEIVDGGAKNRWKITIPATLPTGFTATIDTDGGLILNGETGSSTLTFTTSTQFHAGETVVLSGCPAGGSDESYRMDILRGDNTNYCYGDPVIASNFTEASYQVRIRIAANYTCNNLKFSPMVCTLAAWKISQSFQPYRPSYQELYEMVKALQANQ